MSARPGSRGTKVFLSIAVVAFLPLAACSSGSSGGDKTAPTASASPTSMTFSNPITVTLTAMDNKDTDPAIYYTTDATIPTTMSTLYTGPFMVSDTMVVRFIAVDARGNESEVGLEGYTRAVSGIEMEWAASGHGDIVAEAFRHWDEDGDVQTSCAKCHAEEGFIDFIEDGTTDMAAALPLGHYCGTCHEAAPDTRWDERDMMGDFVYPELEFVEFPSLEIASLSGDSNMCVVCHAGRNSTVQVDDEIAANPGGPHTFINIHYYAAAASYLGTEVKGGYEYTGMDYVGRNIFPSHEENLQTCVGCHMRLDAGSPDHTFIPQIADCAACHTGNSFETLSGSPMLNHDAIQVALPQLLSVIDSYASGTLGFPIAYHPSSYPYFFFDLNNNDIADPEEANFGNRFDEFDDELLRAAYNYQTVAREPAGYIHNGVYLRQLLYDSIVALGFIPMDLAPGRTGFDLDNATKAEQWHLSGHADSPAEAFRHWDEDEDVSTSCAKCHTTPGYIDFAADGTVDMASRLNSLVECSACHNDYNLFMDASTRHDDLVTNMALEPVDFPSGATGTFGDSSNICMSCHQGRESGVSVDMKTPNTVVQMPTDYASYDFVNRHYYAAAAILFASDVTASYEYAGAPAYATMNVFDGPGNVHDSADLDSCVGCHMRSLEDHTFEVQIGDCIACHEGIVEFEDLGLPFSATNVDYDGDGTGESFQGEIDGMAGSLLLLIQAYATGVLPQASPIIYSPHSYPYWFHDIDGDGMVGPGEDSFGNRYRDMDITMLRACFNYHAAQDPCGDIHNYRYVLQTLYDSMDDLDNGVIDQSLPVAILRP